MQRRTLPLILTLVAIATAILSLQQVNPHRQDDERTEIAIADSGNVSASAAARINEKELTYPKAIELVAPDAYINSLPFTLADYIGKKVILVDFWTYSCINCQRTLPYLTAWDSKYRDQGLLIVGVHTPEFTFEKDLANVQRATQKYGIMYPVVLDNEYRTWNAYKNRYWPRHYIIDIDGYIVEDHIGEGDYDTTEQHIQQLLEERQRVLGLNGTITNAPTIVEAPPVAAATPEIYFGYGFARGQLGNTEGWQPGKTVHYSLPARRNENKFYLEGNWKNNPDNMEAAGLGRVFLAYAAQSINVVAGAPTPTTAQVLVDGKNVQNTTISAYDLYPLFAGAFGTHELELRLDGARLYTFTFG